MFPAADTVADTEAHTSDVMDEHQCRESGSGVDVRTWLLGADLRPCPANQNEDDSLLLLAQPWSWLALAPPVLITDCATTPA